MDRTYTGQEFVSALARGTLQDAIHLKGVVKLADNDASVILFAPAVSCARWVKIPLDRIEQVAWLGKVSCRDHTHDYADIQLKETKHPEAVLYAELLRLMAPTGTEAGNPARPGG